MPGQPRAGLQMPPDMAAVSLGNRAGLRQRRSSLLFGGGGKTGLKIRCRSGLQLGLIVFDDEQVVAAAIDNLLTQLALAKHGVARDQPAF